jgi:hypothetical protein
MIPTSKRCSARVAGCAERLLCLSGPAMATSLVVLAACLLSACTRSTADRTAEQVPQPDIRLENGRVLTEVFVLTNESDNSATLFYRTSLSLSDCDAIQKEVRDVWSQSLRDLAIRQSHGDVTIFPEDASGRSQSFIYRRDGTAWREWNFLNCSG